MLEGYKLARKFLFSQYVFRMRDLPYTTQLIPLAAICAEIGKTTFNQPQTQNILSKWFWCGIMGEMYGGANETRYANDMEDVVAEIRGNESQNRTINAAYFSATRLISLQTRNSAAYKGIMALVYRGRCHDFVQGTTIDIVKSMDEAPDIHHSIFVGYTHDEIAPTKGSVKLGVTTALASFIVEATLNAYDKTTNRYTKIRRLGIAFEDVCDEGCEGYNLFTNFDAVERERTVQQTVLDIRQRYGKNAVLNGVNYMPEGTQRERNGFIGGHRAGYDDKSRTR